MRQRKTRASLNVYVNAEISNTHVHKHIHLQTLKSIWHQNGLCLLFFFKYTFLHIYQCMLFQRENVFLFFQVLNFIFD